MQENGILPELLGDFMREDRDGRRHPQRAPARKGRPDDETVQKAMEAVADEHERPGGVGMVLMVGLLRFREIVVMLPPDDFLHQKEEKDAAQRHHQTGARAQAFDRLGQQSQKGATQ